MFQVFGWAALQHNLWTAWWLQGFVHRCCKSLGLLEIITEEFLATALEICFITSVVEGLYRSLKCNFHISFEVQSHCRDRQLDSRLYRISTYDAEPVLDWELYHRTEDRYSGILKSQCAHFSYPLSVKWQVPGVFTNVAHVGLFMLRRKCGNKRNMQLMVYMLFLLSQTLMSKWNGFKWMGCCVLEKSGSIYSVTAVWNSSPGTKELELHQRVETPMLQGFVERGNYFENTESNSSFMGQQ